MRQLGNGTEGAIHTRLSSDCGATFGPDIVLSGSNDIAWVPSVAVSGSRAYVAWVDLKNDNEEEYFRRSTDNGKTWSNPLPLRNDLANSWAPSVATEGKNVYICWFDQKDAPVKLWDAEEELNPIMSMHGEPTTPAPRGGMQINEEEYSRKCAEAKLKVISGSADEYARNGGDQAKLQQIMQEFQAMSSPAGDPLEAERKSDELLKLVGMPVDEHPETGDPEAAGRRIHEKMGKLEPYAYKWVLGGGNQKQLAKMKQGVEDALSGGKPPASYMAKSARLDEALRLLNKQVVLPDRDSFPKHYYEQVMPMRVQAKVNLIQASAPSWVRDGGDPKKLESMLRHFEQQMQQAYKGWNIYFRRSADWGATFEPATRLTNGQGPAQRPSIAVDGGNLYLVWFDGRNSHSEVYEKTSTDSGKTWTPDARLTFGDADNELPGVCANSAGAHVVWVGRRLGTPAIYYKRTLKTTSRVDSASDTISSWNSNTH